MKIRLRMLSIPLILVLLASGITGFSTQYLPDNTLKILKGHEGRFRIFLQNPDDEVKIFEIEESSDITEIEGGRTRYTLQPNTGEEVFLIISPPNGSEIGDTFNIGYTMRGIATNEGEVNTGTMISIGSAFSKSFTALIVSQNKPKFPSNYTEEIAYAGELFEYNVGCIDEDGDKLYYTSTSLGIDENGTISFKPMWRKKITSKITCSDGLETAEMQLKVIVKDERWFAQLWFLIPLITVIIIAVVIVFVKRRKQPEDQPSSSGLEFVR